MRRELHFLLFFFFLRLYFGEVSTAEISLQSYFLFSGQTEGMFHIIYLTQA